MKGKYRKFIVEAVNQKRFGMCQYTANEIKNELPELFEEEWKEGDWLIPFTKDCIVRFDRFIGEKIFKSKEIIGSKAGHIGLVVKSFKKADPKTVEKFLIEEAEKRGFKEGVTIKRGDWLDMTYTDNIIVVDNRCPKEKGFSYNHSEDRLGLKGFIIYEKGNWAEIVEKEIQHNGLTYVLKG